MEETTLDRAAMGRLAKALVFICGPDHPTTVALQAAADMVLAGHAHAILVCNPEICSGHLNFRDRDSHFIFGDACTAVLVEPLERAANAAFEILGTHEFRSGDYSTSFLDEAVWGPNKDKILAECGGLRRARREVMVSGVVPSASKASRMASAAKGGGT